MGIRYWIKIIHFDFDFDSHIILSTRNSSSSINNVIHLAYFLYRSETVDGMIYFVLIIQIEYVSYHSIQLADQHPYKTTEEKRFAKYIDAIHSVIEKKKHHAIHNR